MVTNHRTSMVLQGYYCFFQELPRKKIKIDDAMIKPIQERKEVDEDVT